MSRVFQSIAATGASGVRTNNINENTPDNGVNIDGVAIKDAGITTATLRITTGASSGLCLLSDSQGNATWQPLTESSTPQAAPIATTPYTVPDTPGSVIFVLDPIAADWVVNLPLLGSNTYGKPIRVYNLSKDFSIQINRSGTDTIYNDVDTTIIVQPDSHVSLLGGTAAIPIWFSAT